MNTEYENTAAMSESALASLILPNLILPALVKTEKDHPTVPVSKSNVKNVFSKIDALLPNFTYEFINELIKLNEAKNINLNEMILRSEKFVSSEEYFVKRPEFKELNVRAKQLKLILSRIPDEISDRKAFLETIKEIAAAIKKKLDAVNNLFETMQSVEIKQILDLRKREFVKYSKQFSNTLKAFFRQGQCDEVYSAANCLISQTNLILKTLKEHCDN
ncbi:programmed cell death 10 [Brachionus plicatilis]|uniref:Programmed cell death 10 n=1 Tax=Brachionus plicatilis TaxID=10195 RepID=A0A3M7Q8S8_BRAPC|nr:programmed cell death 10 [Brachionus plicatilis]